MVAKFILKDQDVESVTVPGPGAKHQIPFFMQNLGKALQVTRDGKTILYAMQTVVRIEFFEKEDKDAK
jgi:ABC-type hemin transport system substrate-binding protein